MTLSHVLAVVIIIMQAVLVGVMLKLHKTFSTYTEEARKTYASNVRVLTKLQEVIDQPQREKSA